MEGSSRATGLEMVNALGSEIGKVGGRRVSGTGKEEEDGTRELLNRSGEWWGKIEDDGGGGDAVGREQTVEGGGGG